MSNSDLYCNNCGAGPQTPGWTYCRSCAQRSRPPPQVTVTQPIQTPRIPSKSSDLSKTLVTACLLAVILFAGLAVYGLTRTNTITETSVQTSVQQNYLTATQFSTQTQTQIQQQTQTQTVQGYQNYQYGCYPSYPSYPCYPGSQYCNGYYNQYNSQDCNGYGNYYQGNQITLYGYIYSDTAMQYNSCWVSLQNMPTGHAGSYATIYGYATYNNYGNSCPQSVWVTSVA